MFAGTCNARWDAAGNVRVVGIVGGGEDLPGFADPSTTLRVVLRTTDGVCTMIVETCAALGLLPGRGA